MIKIIEDWLRDESGASAVELGLLLTPLCLLLFGIMHLFLMSYSAMQLNYAAESTARCMVTSANANANAGYVGPCYVNTGTTSATSYFNGIYHGITSAPTLTLDETQTCGTTTSYQVVATAPYRINVFSVNWTVTLTAKACFPHS